MKKILALVLVLVLTACASPTSSPSSPTTPSSATATSVPKPSESPKSSVPPTTAPSTASTAVSSVASATTSATTKPVSQPGLALPTAKNDLFSASGNCAACHTGIKDTSGADVSFDTQWRATMHANAATDPYWLATVRSEVNANPALQAVIEDKCAACHMPMARTTAVSKSKTGVVLGDGFANSKNDLHNLASDAVSCTVCHQIADKNLGKKEGTSGGFTIDTTTPAGKRIVFTPFKPDSLGSQLMQGSSGFMLELGAQIQKSEMCATCHTLYTPFVDSAGKVSGELPEQMQYAEWQASNYADKITCQGCHMPAAQGAVKTSILSTNAKQPLMQHLFPGGNAFMLKLLQANIKDLQLTASTEQFDATIKAVIDQLQKKTATIEVADTKLSGTQLTANIIVKNNAGHKFPSGFPSRRAWLHVTVQDANGKVVFESGAFKDDGSIIGNDNDGDATKFEPHYATIDSADKVQIYETQIKDTDGKLTTILLRGSAYAKDNRLLPAGFDKDKAEKDIAVIGDAKDDKSFIGGTDTVQYVMNVGSAQGPFTVNAELLYQSISYRWAENLKLAKGDEVTQFAKYFKTVPNTPVVVVSATTKVDK